VLLYKYYPNTRNDEYMTVLPGEVILNVDEKVSNDDGVTTLALNKYSLELSSPTVNYYVNVPDNGEFMNLDLGVNGELLLVYKIDNDVKTMTIYNGDHSRGRKNFFLYIMNDRLSLFNETNLIFQLP